MNILSYLYEPLQYALLFPHEAVGWLPKINISQKQWYHFSLVRKKWFLSIERLTCKNLVNMYSRLEEERLSHVRFNGKGQANFGQQGHHYSLQNMLPASIIGS